MLQHFESRLAVHLLLILTVQRRVVQQTIALVIADRPHSRAGGDNHRPLDHRRAAFLIEEGDQRLAGAQLLDRLFGTEGRVGAHGLGGGFHRLLVLRRKGAQGMLHAVAQLADHGVGNIRRVLRDKVDADALGADKADHLFNFIQQHLRRVVEQQMRLIEEEHQLRFIEVAGFRQALVELGEHPQQAGGVQLRHLVELFGAKDIDHPFTAGIDAHPVGNIQHRLAEEVLGALLLQGQQPALDGADRGAVNIAVLVLERLGVIADKLGDCAEVFEVEQQLAAVVRDAENNVQYAALHLVEIEQARQQQGAEIGNRRPHRVALLAKDIPEHHRVGVRLPVADADLLQPRLQFL